MLVAGLAGALALAGAQPEGRPVADLSPAEAAILLQDYLAQGMAATYSDGETSEGRYVIFGERSLTVARRGYRNPGGEYAGGWYVTEHHIHRFDLEPVEVRFDPEVEEIVMTLRCAPEARDCIMAQSANAMFPMLAEDHDANTLSIGLAMYIYEDGYAEEMEQLFEIWRTAPQTELAPIIYD